MAEEYYRSAYTGAEIENALGRVVNGEFDDAVTAAEAAQREVTRVAALETARSVWGKYSALKAYVPGNKVVWNGGSYLNIAACTGVTPADEMHWLLIAAPGVEGRTGPSGDGSGDMTAAVYDTKGKRVDVFDYMDGLVGDVAAALDVLLNGNGGGSGA